MGFIFPNNNCRYLFFMMAFAFPSSLVGVPETESRVRPTYDFVKHLAPVSLEPLNDVASASNDIVRCFGRDHVINPLIRGILVSYGFPNFSTIWYMAVRLCQVLPPRQNDLSSAKNPKRVSVVLFVKLFCTLRFGLIYE